MPAEREIEDGFGSIWTMCNRADCDLQVVRPGKVQCRGERDDTCVFTGEPPTPLAVLAAKHDELEERVNELAFRVYLLEPQP